MAATTARRSIVHEVVTRMKLNSLLGELGDSFTRRELEERINLAVNGYDFLTVARMICTLSPHPGQMTRGDARRKLKRLLAAAILELAASRNYVEGSEGIFRKELAPAS